MEARFFKTPADFRKWLAKNHASVSELWVGYYKKDSGRPSITWPESVDEALCFGWIDGIRKSIDAESYRIRFTPRKEKSIWSTVNIKRASELIAAGRMTSPGLEAFEKRKEDLARRYSYEQQECKLDPPYEKIMKANRAAWKFFQSQPPYYRRTMSWWVMSAKREETRMKRLEKLIEDSANNRRILPMQKKT